jgi:hypothetical protein
VLALAFAGPSGLDRVIIPALELPVVMWHTFPIGTRGIERNKAKRQGGCAYESRSRATNKYTGYGWTTRS